MTVNIHRSRDASGQLGPNKCTGLTRNSQHLYSLNYELNGVDFKSVICINPPLMNVGSNMTFWMQVLAILAPQNQIFGP